MSERRRRTPRPVLTDDSRPAMARRGDVKQQQGISFDLALLEYVRRSVIYMSHRHPDEPGSESIAALIDQALREKLDRWERTYTGGQALPMLGTEPAQTTTALLHDPNLTWEDVPADQAPPPAEDETVQIAAPAPAPRPDARGHVAAEADALTWTGLLAELVTLTRRTILGRR